MKLLSHPLFPLQWEVTRAEEEILQPAGSPTQHSSLHLPVFLHLKRQRVERESKSQPLPYLTPFEG